MPSWKDFLEQLAVIQAAPIPFGLAAIMIVSIVWFVVNWSYTSAVTSKISQIELLDRQITDYKEKLNGASPSEAKARIDALETRLARLEPRHLSDAKRQTILRLAALPYTRAFNIKIAYDGACSDCNHYSSEIVHALRTANWNVAAPVVMGPGVLAPSGMAPNINNPPQEIVILARTFREAGVPFDMIQTAGQESSIQINSTVTP